MISVIICSKSNELYNIASENIKNTICLPYEIVLINNTKGQLGICAAYNQGASQSKYDILCFMHEDILIHTNNWGGIVADILSDPKIGLVGVTGTKYLGYAPGPWWSAGIDYCRRNVLEHYADGTQEKVLQNPEQERLSQVAVVDGLWFCTRREVWQQCPFDEQTFPDFHLYDLDFSAQILQHYKVVVTFDILIEHFSRGNFNHTWVKNTLAFMEKWKRSLPLSVLSVPPKNARQRRKRAYQAFCTRMLSLSYNKKILFRYLLKSLSYNPFDRDSLWLLKEWLKKARWAGR